MPVFEHPLQLFTLEYPEHWEPRYQEETGGVMFVYPHAADATALSLSVLAVTGSRPALSEELAQAAERLGVSLTPDTVRFEARDETEIAYGEGTRTEGELLGPVRFWLIRHATLALYTVQLGPGAALDELRAAADRMLETLRFPELLPPTPEEFRARVLEILRREYPEVAAAPESDWAVQIRDSGGETLGTIGLENLYRACLLNPETAGARIREHLDQVLAEPPEMAEFYEYERVRDRLLPMLKSEEWTREAPASVDLVRVEFAPGLVMCFVVDEPNRVAYVTREMLENWDVPLERVQGVAQDNLARKERELQVAALSGEDDRTYGLLLQMQDGYDATRLCVPRVREAFAEELGDEYLVGVPNRDFLVAFTDRDPEMTRGIIDLVHQQFRQMSHPLTPTIYRVRTDSIEPTEL